MQHLDKALATAAIWAGVYFLSEKQHGYFGWLLFIGLLITLAIWDSK